MSSHFRLMETVEFVKRFISKDLHPDGRKLLEFRSTSLQTNLFSSADGSSLVRHGNTVVVASVKGELSETDFKSKSDQGRVLLSIEGQPYFTENMQNDLAKACTAIKSLFDTNKIIELSELCLLKEKICWTLFVDVTCLDCDGAVLDTCLLAVLSALHYASLPIVNIEQQTKVVGENQRNNENVDEFLPPSTDTSVVLDEDLTSFDALLSNVRVDFKNRKPIKLTDLLPVACTFALIDITEGVSLACDPTEEEKMLFSNNDFSLVVAEENKREVLCGIYKYGGTASIDESMLDLSVDLARRRRSHMLRLIREVSNQKIHSV